MKRVLHSFRQHANVRLFAVPHSPAGLDPETEENFTRCFVDEWAVALMGIEANADGIAIRRHPVWGGRGLFARRDLRDGDTVAVVPASAMIQADSWDSALEPSAAAALSSLRQSIGLTHADEWEWWKLALVTARERLLGPSRSRYGPYVFGCIPSKPLDRESTLPLWRSLLVSATGSNAASVNRAIQEADARVATQAQALASHFFGSLVGDRAVRLSDVAAAVRWGYDAGISRAHLFAGPSTPAFSFPRKYTNAPLEGSCPSLCPFFDLINHADHRPPNVVFVSLPPLPVAAQGSGKGPRLLVEVHGEVGKDEELVMKYDGSGGPLNSYLRFGFIPS